MVDRNQDKKIFLIKKFQLYVCILYKMEGISNKTIAKFFAEKASDDVKKIFSVFPSNFVTRFITFHSMLRESGAQYPLIITNTDRNDRKGTHWWSFLDLHPPPKKKQKTKKLSICSFGFECFKEFILQGGQKVLNKILYGIEKFNKKDNEITLITLAFSMKEYEKN